MQFQEVSSTAGLNYVGRSWGSAWGDYNGDGIPDIWMPNHQNSPSLLVNQGNGTFVDVAPTVLDSTYLVSYDKHGAAWADFDNDGDQDLYQLADQGAVSLLDDWFFENNGGVLTESAAVLGLQYTNGRGRMPLWLDFDGNGLLDVFHPVHRRGDGLDGPSTFFSQGAADVFTDAAALIGYVQPTGSTNFALQGDVSGDGVFEFLPDRSRFPDVVYDLSAVPFVDVRASLGIPTTCCAVDALLADLDGDLDNDIYVVRGERLQSFVQTDSASLEVHLQGSSALPPFNTETGISFQTSGSILIDPHPFWELTDVFIGQFGYHPSLFPVGLSPADSSNWGILPHVPDVDTGLYIGWDNTAQAWEIYRSDKVANLAITSTSAISGVQAINWDPADPPRADVFLQNQGGNWSDVTVASGIAESSEGRNIVAGDFDNDMDLDIYIVATAPTQNTPNILYENQGGGSFTKLVSHGAEGDSLGRGDAVSVADYDMDGFLDLLVTNGVSKSPFELDGPTDLYRNQGNANHWLQLDLVGGPASNRDAVGARIVLTAGGQMQLREQNAGTHYRAQNFKRIHFGLGPNTQADLISITWPSGTVTQLTDVAADQVLTVTEVQSTDAPVVQATPEGTGFTAFPNPFNGTTTVLFNLARSQPVDLTVHDVTGRVVQRIIPGVVLDRGAHEISWNGRDSGGRLVSSGIYFMRLDTGGRSETHRVAMVRGR